jgi:hypothetical protein
MLWTAGRCNAVAAAQSVYPTCVRVQQYKQPRALWLCRNTLGHNKAIKARHRACMNSFPRLSWHLCETKLLTWPLSKLYKPGVQASSALSQSLRNLRQDTGSHVTFMFDGTIVAVPASILWNIGATLSFVDALFVERRGLHVQPSPLDTTPVDGNAVQSPGFEHAQLCNQTYHATLRLCVLPLPPEFSVLYQNILYDCTRIFWYSRHQLVTTDDLQASRPS